MKEKTLIIYLLLFITLVASAQTPQAEQGDTLPMPEIRYGIAIIRGQLLHTSNDAQLPVILYQSASRYQFGATALDTLWARVSDNGRFEFRLPVTHSQPVILVYDGKLMMMCYAGADETTEEVKPYVTEAYLQMLSSQKQLLCPAFMGVAHLLSRMPTMYPDYVDHEVNAFSMKQQLHKDYTQLDSVQLQQNMATLPKAYQLWIEDYRQQLSQLMADNSQRTGYEICQLPEVPPYSDHLLFERVCKRYRGRLIFLHIWHPTINRDMAMTRNIIMPLQKEFEDYDIAWVHLARHKNETSWRQQLPQLPGYHYPFTTSYQPTGIIRSVMGKHQSPYLYVIVDETGRVVYKHNNTADLTDLREQLKKYAKKKQ